MESKKTSTGKYVLFIMLFLITAVITFVSKGIEAEQLATMSMSEAELPIVMISTEDGLLYNRMHGYTTDIKAELLKTGVSYLSTEKRLNVVIDTYGEEIESVSYKIRDLNDGMSLIENTAVDNIQIDDNRGSAVFNIKNLISDNTEYMMEINVSTANRKDISYYTRIMSAGDVNLSEKLQFVCEFNGYTFDKENLDKTVKYLETSSQADNSNYGKVNINNSKYMVGWGSLEPVVNGNIIPTVYDAQGDIGIVSLDYTIGCQNLEESNDEYAVHEFYRVRYTQTRMYLLNFDRETTQIFDGKNVITSSGNINLGINPDQNVEAVSSSENKFNVFVNQGNLWSYNVAQSIFTKVFTFRSEDGDNVRESFVNYDIRIMDVTDEGDVEFLVYGYMNRGVHEGETGISLCRYSYSQNEVEEFLYIPVDVPFELLCENVGKIAYINGDNVFSVLIDDTLYSIDLKSKEVMTEISGLVDGTYQVSDNGRSIAYSTNGELNDTSEIRVLNLENAADYYIKADDDKKLKALGYIEDDFIYGTARVSDIITDTLGFVTFPMYRVDVLDSQFNIVKSYEQPDVYISSAQVEGLRITFSRVVKNGSGGYSNASVDQLISKDENTQKQGAVIDTISTNANKTEVIIKPASKTKKKITTVRSFKTVNYRENNEFNLKQGIEGADVYYITGFGEHRGCTIRISDAILSADKMLGEVLDNKNIRIWKRFKPSSARIKGISSDIASDYDSFENALAKVKAYAGETKYSWLSIKGVSGQNVLSFVGDGIPVIAGTNSGYVVIIGYDSEDITYINMANGKESTVSQEEAVKMFAQAGNVFVTYYKG